MEGKTSEIVAVFVCLRRIASFRKGPRSRERLKENSTGLTLSLKPLVADSSWVAILLPFRPKLVLHSSYSFRRIIRLRSIA